MRASDACSEQSTRAAPDDRRAVVRDGDVVGEERTERLRRHFATVESGEMERRAVAVGGDPSDATMVGGGLHGRLGPAIPRGREVGQGNGGAKTGRLPAAESGAPRSLSACSELCISKVCRRGLTRIAGHPRRRWRNPAVAGHGAADVVAAGVELDGLAAAVVDTVAEPLGLVERWADVDTEFAFARAG